MRYVHYVEAYSFVHIMLRKCGWVEDHTIIADGKVMAKMVKVEGDNNGVRK